jgi:predicted ester cyclase
MTEAEIRAHADAVFLAMNEHDVDGLLEHLADDVVWIEPGHLLRGKDAAAAHQKAKFEAFPDMHFSAEAVRLTTSLDPPSYASPWETTGTMLGALLGIPATGRAVRFSGTTVCTFRSGLISEYRVDYDRLDLLQQLGVLPKTDGLGFKTVAMFNLMLHRDRKALHQ